MVLLEQEQVNLGGHAGILVKVLQNVSGTEYLKWLLAFGDEKETLLITALFPKELELELSQKLKASVLTARWDREKKIGPTEGLNFSIIEKGELRIAKRIANSLLYSTSGAFPSRDIDDPFLVVGPSPVGTGIGDPEEFAKSRVRKTAEVTDVEIEGLDKASIDNLSGYEIVANAKDKESGRPMTIYQLILFDDQRYFIIQGLVSSKNRESGLAVFKEMAKTFRRK